MKIAYLVNQYPGISHTFVRREIAALERLGVEVSRFAVRPSKQGLVADEDREEEARTRRIVGAPWTAIAGAVLRAFFADPGRAIAELPSIVRFGWRSEAGLFRHVLYYLEALVLADWMRGERLAHVHAHFGTNSATVALMASRLTGAAFSFTVHGPEEFDKPGLIALKRKIEEAALTVVISSYGLAQARRLVGREHWDRIKIVHCGVEQAFHASERAAPPLSAKRFVCVGRLCEQKGQLTLIEAAALLKEAGRDFEIVLVGDGEMRGDLEAAAREHKICERIIFAGWKSPAEVRRAIEEARAFVLPSYAEGLPVSIMEAFLLARPVISTYIAGIPELVEPGANGWLAPAGDAAALAEAMGEALDADDGAILAMGAAGREKTLVRHDIDREAAKLLDCFRALEAPQC